MKKVDSENRSIADADELPGITANRAGEKPAGASALIQRNLQIVKDSMVAAEAAVIESAKKAAKIASQHIRDSHWNWH